MDEINSFFIKNQIDGTKIHCVSWSDFDSSKDTLILLHGFQENWMCTKPIGDSLSNRFNVISYDARGHGKSDSPKSGYDYETRVNDLKTILKNLNIKNPILYGFSMGVETVVETINHPNINPKAMILAEPPTLFEWEKPSNPKKSKKNFLIEKREEIEKFQSAKYKNIHRAAKLKFDGWWGDTIATARKQIRPEAVKIGKYSYEPIIHKLEKFDGHILILRADPSLVKYVKDDEKRRIEPMKNTELKFINNAKHAVLQHNEEDVINSITDFVDDL